MLTTAAVTLGLLLPSMKGQRMIEAATGCGWSGHMPGPGGSRPGPSPVSNQTYPVTPSYRNIWPCLSVILTAPEDSTMATVQMEREAISKSKLQLDLLVGWGGIQAKHLSRPPSWRSYFLYSSRMLLFST